jgi:hypothetical protein
MKYDLTKVHIRFDKCAYQTATADSEDVLLTRFVIQVRHMEILSKQIGVIEYEVFRS